MWFSSGTNLREKRALFRRKLLLILHCANVYGYKSCIVPGGCAVDRKRESMLTSDFPADDAVKTPLKREITNLVRARGGCGSFA